MTDLWLHVNTFFIIVLIFFRYGSYIKKYMAVFLFVYANFHFAALVRLNLFCCFLSFSPGNGQSRARQTLRRLFVHFA